MLEIETLSWQIISLINMYCSSSSLLGVFCLKSFIFILYTYGHIDWATKPHWLFFPCGLAITAECFTHCRLSAATSAFIQNFLQPVMVTQHLQSKKLKGGRKQEVSSLRQVCSTEWDLVPSTENTISSYRPKISPGHMLCKFHSASFRVKM